MKKYNLFFILISSAIFFSGIATAAMNHAGMSMDETGMIMNANPDKLPKDCKEVSEDVHFTVHAGRKYAEKFNGKMFTYDQQEWNVKGCTRIKFTLVNDDEVRHQLMIHGLPGYLYPKGMFTIEINGKGKKEASLIVPTNPKTYLVHCDIAQHTEQGMKGQLKVAGGDVDIPSIPGLTPDVTPDVYPILWNNGTWMLLLLSVVAGFVVPFFLIRNK